MYIIYSIPIWPIILIILALFNAGASWIRDCLPILAGLIIIKNLYIDLYYSIRKSSHNPFAAILIFIFGIARVAIFFPILNVFLTNTGGVFGLIDLLLSLVFVVPIISFVWLLGELSSLAYGIGAPKYAFGTAITGNLLSIAFIFAIYFFFFH